jgi:hypothetical protein
MNTRWMHTLSRLDCKSKPLTGRDVLYPLEPQSNPSFGDTYINIDEFRKYYFNGKTYYKATDYITLDNMRDMTFWASEKEDTYYTRIDKIEAGFIDLYLYHYVNFSTVLKFTARKDGFPIVIYQFVDKSELAMFQMLMGNQIK